MEDVLMMAMASTTLIALVFLGGMFMMLYAIGSFISFLFTGKRRRDRK